MWSCNSVRSSLLTTSVCNSSLSKMSRSTPSPSDNPSNDGISSNVFSVAMPSRCSLEATEKELNDLWSYSTLVTPACAEGMLSLVCRYIYRSCSTDPSFTPSTTVTLDECLSLRDIICRDAWPLIERYLNFADSGCLASFTGCDVFNTNHSTDQSGTVPVLYLWDS